MVFPVEILGIYVSQDHDFVGHHGKPRGQNPVSVVAEAECVAGQGIRGDRYFGFKENYKAQITFFDQAVHEAVQSKFDLSTEPSVYRRNVLLAGLDLHAANMSRSDARVLAQSGLAGAAPERVQRLHLDRPLPATAANNLNQEIDAAHCGYAPKEMIEAMAFAQFARDAHMAREMQTNGESDGAILIAGAGHARGDRAVPFHLRRMAPGRAIVSLAFLEVSEGENAASAYAAPFGSEVLPFDYVWFTPRVDIRDACERFEEQLKKMRGE